MSTGLFDEIRVFYGSDQLTTIFNDLVNNNVEEAVKSINNKNLHFPSLFILQHEINRSGITDRLSLRNKYALKLINQLAAEESLDSARLLSEYTQANYSTIRWILETGYSEDGLSDEYDEVLDTAAIILSRVYNDNSCLKIIDELIFNRYRKGAYIYDLVWAFFETITPQNINMVVNRLRSSNPKDIELARKFLNFIPCMNSEEDPLKQYQCCIRWVNQNHDFLYYTGVTNQQTTNPSRYAVSLEAKYLQKPASLVLSDQTRSLRKEELSYLDNFKDIDEDSKLLLANYSDMMYRTNKSRWSRWLQSPIEKQLEIARRVMGGEQ